MYFIGSTDNERVINAQRMALACLTQYAKYRSNDSRRIICILDEFRVFISRVVVNGMATLRSSNLLFWIGFQSFGDFEVGPTDLNPNYVKSSLLSNTGLKFTFKIPDPETVEFLTKLSGTKLESQIASTYELTTALSEVKSDVLQVTEVQVPHIPHNYLLSLKPLTCFVYGVGTPQFIYTNKIDVPDEELIDIALFRRNLKQSSGDEDSPSVGGLIDVD